MPQWFCVIICHFLYSIKTVDKLLDETYYSLTPLCCSQTQMYEDLYKHRLISLEVWLTTKETPK